VVGALEGQRALVTGASRGIGRAVARALAHEGARLVLCARDGVALDLITTELGATAVVADMSVTADVERLVVQTERAFGPAPDIIVSAAGAFGLGPLATTSVEVFDQMMAVNLRAPFLLLRAFLPVLLQRRAGHIVSVGSIAGRQAISGNGAYAASKFGLRGLHAVLDTELRGTGVRATLVEPAATDTTLWDAIDTELNPGLPARSAMLLPEDVASAVLYVLTRRPEVDVRNLLLERA
jgi:NADP-dependent 3-hydroxy acid dehydrogenase YdfG